MEELDSGGAAQYENDIRAKMKSLRYMAPEQLGDLYNSVLELGCFKGHDYLNPIVDESLSKMALRNHHIILKAEPLEEGNRYEFEDGDYLVKIIHDGYGFLTYEITDQRLLPNEDSLFYDERTRDPKKAVVCKIRTYSPPSQTMENLCAWLFYPSSVLKEAAGFSNEPYLSEEELNLAIDSVLKETYFQRCKRHALQTLDRARERVLDKSEQLISKF